MITQIIKNTGKVTVLITIIVLSSCSLLKNNHNKKIMSKRISDKITLKEYNYSIDNRYVENVESDFERLNRLQYVEFSFRDIFDESKIKLKSRDSVFFDRVLEQKYPCEYFFLINRSNNIEIDINSESILLKAYQIKNYRYVILKQIKYSDNEFTINLTNDLSDFYCY